MKRIAFFLALATTMLSAKAEIQIQVRPYGIEQDGTGLYIDQLLGLYDSQGTRLGRLYLGANYCWYLQALDGQRWRVRQDFSTYPMTITFFKITPDRERNQ